MIKEVTTATSRPIGEIKTGLPTDRPTNQPTDMRVNREVTLPILRLSYRKEKRRGEKQFTQNRENWSLRETI